MVSQRDADIVVRRMLIYLVDERRLSIRDHKKCVELTTLIDRSRKLLRRVEANEFTNKEIGEYAKNCAVWLETLITHAKKAG